MKESHLKSRRLLGVILAGLLLGLFVSSPALGHSAILWAYVEGDRVFVEAFFSDGAKVKDGRIIVADAEGKKLLEARTNHEGKFDFVPANKNPIKILLILDEHHKNTFDLTAEDMKDLKIGEEKKPDAKKTPEEKPGGKTEKK